jgi:hypothetical protein
MQAEAALQQWLPLAIYTQRTTKCHAQNARPNLRGGGATPLLLMLALGLSCAPACERGEARCHFLPVCVTSTLIFCCPHCGHALVRKGAWFQTVRGFKCGGCWRMLRLTYDDKVALFDKHAHLICSAAPMTV